MPQASILFSNATIYCTLYPVKQCCFYCRSETVRQNARMTRCSIQSEVVLVERRLNHVTDKLA